jgi:hypothetical protein
MSFDPSTGEANVTRSQDRPVYFHGLVSGSFGDPLGDPENFMLVNLSWTHDLGWEIIVSPAQILLMSPYRIEDVNICVVVPEDTECSTRTITVTATADNGVLNFTRSDVLTVRVNPFYWIAFDSRGVTDPFRAEMASTVECSVEMYNLGNTPETVDVFINDTGHILATPEQSMYVTTVTIPVNGSTEVPIVLRIRDDINPWKDRFVWIVVNGRIHMDPNGSSYQNPINGGFWVSFESPGTEILRADHGVPIFLGFIAIPVATALIVYRYRTSRRASDGRSRAAAGDGQGPTAE